LVAIVEFIDPLRTTADFLWSLVNQVAHFLAVTMWSWISANMLEFLTGLSNTITPMQLPNREAIEQINSMVSIIVLGSTFLGIGALIAASMLKERMKNKKSSAIIG
jgi:CDP-diglyceride synthetase